MITCRLIAIDCTLKVCGNNDVHASLQQRGRENEE
jgi:hypothetical protein